MIGFVRTGALLCALGVAAGAFGAHGLRDSIEPRLFQAYETGVHYHLLHALSVFVLALSALPQLVIKRANLLFIFGILVFSGSLYLMALTGQRWLGAITPIGGVSFIVGWIVIAFSKFESRHSA